jgi:hypothetical protein
MPMLYFLTCGPYIHSRTREGGSHLDRNQFTVHLIVFELGLHIIWCNLYSFLLCLRIEMQNKKLNILKLTTNVEHKLFRFLIS